MRVYTLGYCATGSSAITDLLSEYQNSAPRPNLKGQDYEHLLFYMPRGLFDLEDSLLNNNALFRSDAALNDFYNAMLWLNDNDFGWFGGYKKRFGAGFMSIVNAFLSSLVEFTLPGGWSNDYVYRKRKYTFIDIIRKLKHKMMRQNSSIGLMLDRKGADGKINLAFPKPEDFYRKASVFIESYYALMGWKESNVPVIDQIIQPHHLLRFMNYARPDDRFIVVRRDPRDVYLKSKYIWKRKGDYVFPDSPNKFVSFYRSFMGSEKLVSDSRILRIYFEDLVYKYDETVRLIESFIGVHFLGPHVSKTKFFNPRDSIKNTQLFSISSSWEEEALSIAKGLPEMVYDFPYVSRTSLGDITDGSRCNEE